MNLIHTFIAELKNIVEADQVKAYVQYIDEVFCQSDNLFGPDDWVSMANAIAKWKGSRTGRIEPKRCWRILFKNGKFCTMIIEDPCDYQQALQDAKNRFFNDVLIVE